MREKFEPKSWKAGVSELSDANRRWMRAAYSALLRCAETKDVGMKKFLEYADKTQRELVGKTAKDFYCKELGVDGDSLESFFGATNVGVVGAGFDYEVNRHFTETSVSAEQYRCPLIDHAKAAGYDINDPALKDLSLWCDMYDNFESAAVAPSIGMVHSHCLGVGDRQCRWFIEIVDEAVRRKTDENIYEYLGRMRKLYREKGDGPWVIDRLSPEEIYQITYDNVKVTEDQQDELFPTPEEKAAQGVIVSNRISASSVLIAGTILGWDRFIAGMAKKEGPILTGIARAKANERGIYGFTVRAAYHLREALNIGTGYEPYEIEEETEKQIIASARRCPLVEAAVESGLGEHLKNIKPYCSAVATFDNKAVSDDITTTFTHCIGCGDGVCRCIIEKK